ncbi:MAG: polynucleotide adenylyltransferase PcnB [Pseudomonadales bacterium]|nr:polynucleotide adenylyltransferase PcnB [Pseudomonadales bacterium]
MTASQPSNNSVLIPRDQHTISRRNISINALKVMQRLNQSDFQAYLVGGAVRDMMLDKQPKDFDVATDATPEQIRKVFKNSRIIGRRFRIVHIRFGREIIEVTTFRGSHDNADENDKHQSSANDHGMLLRDNVFGTVEEDAQRRDFTVNSFYYSSQNFAVYDFADGLKDIEDKKIRLIGDPSTRYKEDPVRMLRALRFCAKLDFELEQETGAAIGENAALLDKIPAARLFDESLKLFISGQGEKTLELLQQHDLAQYLIANHKLFSDDPVWSKLLQQALYNTDQRLAIGKSITPAFLYAVFLWPSLKEQMAILATEGMPVTPALHAAAHQVIGMQMLKTSIPKRFQATMKEIWEMQLRLPKIQGNHPLKLLEHPRFRAAYDFLLLREDAGEIEAGLGQWWTDFQKEHPIPPKVYTPRGDDSQGDDSDNPRRRRNHKRKPRNGNR